VYADINNINVYNRNGVEDFVLQQYNFDIEADVDLDSSITPEKVKLKHSAGLSANFESCSNSICRINIVRGINSEVELCPYSSFSIELYERVPGTPIDTETFVVNCDSQPPSIDLSVTPKAAKSGTVTLNYNIIDHENAATKCSGIEKIEIYNSFSTGAATIITNSTDCSKSSSTIIDTSSYNDGEITIYVKAYDRLGQTSIANTSLIIDKTGPEAAATVQITDLHGGSIPYFTPQTVLVDVTLDITDLAGVKSYNLDYSELTSATPNCNRAGTNIVCRWDNIRINMDSASFTKTIRMDAIDILGNSAARDILVQNTLSDDKSPPSIIISNIRIDTIDNSEIEWFKPGLMKMSFSADITDDNSGIDVISGDFSNIDVVSGSSPVCSGSGNSYHCDWENLVFNIDSAAFSKDIKVVAKDKAGNEKTESKTATISYKDDKNAPQISNFKITNLDNSDITGWIKDANIPVKISVDVVEKGSGLDSIKGLFKDINPLYYEYIDGTCTQVRGPGQTSGIYQEGISDIPEYQYKCSWNVNIRFANSGNPLSAQFKFNATDNSLNSALPSFSQAFKVDVDSPVVSSLRTTKVFNRMYYVGGDSNTFIAAINDPGIGINNKNVYLNLKNLGLGNNVKADECSGGNCYWYLPGVSTGADMSTISVNTNTKDDLGNSLSKSFKINVTIDTVKPYLEYVNVTAVAASTALYEDYIQTGNALYIMAVITEDTSILSATGDFSNFILDETEDLADSCERYIDDDGYLTNTWACIWATDEIDIKTYRKAPIYLNFTDIAGNSYVHSYTLEVFEALGQAYDYWDNNIGQSSPHAVDRQIITMYHPNMWFPIELVSREGKSASQRWPLEILVDNCQSDLTDSSGTQTAAYLSSINGNLPLLINPNTDTSTILPYNIYLNYELENAAPKDHSIEIMCQLKIKTLVDQKRISPYEYENITVKIDYYNNPLGELASNIDQEINNIAQGWLVSAKWLGTIDKIVSIAKTICNLINNLYKISKIPAAWSDLAKANPVTHKTGVALGIVAGGLSEAAEQTWQHTANKFCKILNCQLFYGADWGGSGKDGESAGNPIADWGRMASKYSKFWTPQNSLITSIVFMCLPGVIHNLQKARVIDCQYANCLKSTAYGMPVQMCLKQRDYAWCNYVYGEMFNWIPFAGMVSAFLQRIKAMLSQPVEIIGVGLKLICKAQCGSSAIGCKPCLVIEGLNLILDVMCDLGIGSDNCEPFWDDLTVDDSVCSGITGEKD